MSGICAIWREDGAERLARTLAAVNAGSGADPTSARTSRRTWEPG